MHKNTSLLVEDFVSLQVGEPFRLFGFGTIYKNGQARNITPEFARTIQLPHFRPPIKLSSHEDNAPAGGFITALEIHEDGIYALPEWNEQGLKAIQEGAFRYNSPEILWNGGLENPTTGSVMNAPTIVGTALLHTPHLGEAAALYSVETIEISQENKNMSENFNIPVSFWDKFIAPLLTKPAEKVEVVKVVEPDDYTAVKAQVEQYKAEAERMRADAERKARVEKFDAELKETKADPTLSDLLADLTPEKAEVFMKQLKALSSQIDESKLTTEQGTTAAGATSDDPQAAFNAAVLALAAEKKINYIAAFEQAKTTHADLFKAWAGK